jgi:hypothetical protein
MRFQKHMMEGKLKRNSIYTPSTHRSQLKPTQKSNTTKITTLNENKRKIQLNIDSDRSIEM